MFYVLQFLEIFQDGRDVGRWEGKVHKYWVVHQAMNLKAAARAEV